MKVIGLSDFNKFNKRCIKKAACIFFTQYSNIIIIFIKDGKYHNENYEALNIDGRIKSFYFKDKMIKRVSSLSEFKKTIKFLKIKEKFGIFI